MDRNIKKEILKYAIPGILGLVANSLYIVIDGIFVAQMLGDASLAAVTTVVPIVELLIALSLMISIGGGIYISISKGKNDFAMARSYFNHGFYFMLGIGLIILLISLLFTDQIIWILGATEAIFNEAKTYFLAFIVFVPFFMMNYALGTWIRNDGNPKLAMISQIMGAIINIVLDYVFMGPLNLGIKGAAIATGLGPVVGIILLLPHFLMKKGDLFFEKVTYKRTYIKEIALAGLPSFSIEFALGVMTFIMNLFLVQRFGQNGLSAFAVVGYVNLILLSIFLGLGQGTQPIISQFKGKEDHQTIQAIYKYSLKLSVILGFLSILVTFSFKRKISSIFIAPEQEELYQLTLTAMRLFFITYPATGINLATASVFEAKHEVKPSIIISLLRSLLILFPVALFLSYLKIDDALWIAVPLTELFTVPISLYLWRKYDPTDALTL
ncbi:MAG TPA: MATE family efflux transporter [Erysipelothrix sp.]